MKKRGKFVLKYCQRRQKHFKATDKNTKVSARTQHVITTLNVIG